MRLWFRFVDLEGEVCFLPGRVRRFHPGGGLWFVPEGGDEAIDAIPVDNLADLSTREG